MTTSLKIEPHKLAPDLKVGDETEYGVVEEIAIYPSDVTVVFDDGRTHRFAHSWPVVLKEGI